MRALLRTVSLPVLLLGGCASAPPPKQAAATPAPAASPAPPAAPAPVIEKIGADTPRTTAEGNTFIAPAGWTLTTRGALVVLEPPEGDSHIALFDVRAKDADAAVAAAWAAYKPDFKWPLKLATPAPDREGWTAIKGYEYQTSPNEKREVGVGARLANGVWTVNIYDMTTATGEKRAAQIGLLFGKFLPKGYSRESFAGKKAQPLDVARVGELGSYVERAMAALRVPGVSIGLVQDGKVVFVGGFGVKQLGKADKPDGDTMYMIASNTKALTTLMLAKLVDEKKLTWETAVTSVLPQFKLADPATTKQVLVKHLICACTGMPRQDMEWLFQWQGVTPAAALDTLGTMQPTSKFGELFQYSNPLAAAGGFVGGHVAFPKLELGRAYDEAMRTRVFEPLGMKATTFDYARAQKGNHAAPHSQDVDGKTALAKMELNYSIIPQRPAGAAWSNVNDVLKYVQMELGGGVLAGGKRYLDKEVLLARRAPQVALGKDATYGMGLMVDKKYEVEVVHHGGDMIGFHSDMMWLPEHGVGAVVLTNGDPGWVIRDQFRRKLLEVLFDGKPEADAQVAQVAKNYFEAIATERKLLAVPADPAAVQQLAKIYKHLTLGEIRVTTKDGVTSFDFGEWQSDVATRKNPDGTTSFITIAPGGNGFEFVLGTGEKKTLTLRDAQHEYVFAAE